MMKKTTSALAIAALLGSGAATAATFQIDDDTTFGVSGRISPYYTDVEVMTDPTEISGEAFTVDDDSDESTRSAGSVAINATRDTESEGTYSDTSRVIFSGNHALDSGLTAILNYELRQVGNTSNDGISDSNVEARTAFIGMEGDDFGRLTFGRQPSTYKAAIGGYQDVTYFGGVTLAENVTNNRNLRYSTPSLGGVTLHAGAQVNGDATEADNNDSSSSLSGAIVFDGPGFTLTAAYDQAEYIDRDAQGIEFRDASNAADFEDGYSVVELDAQSAKDFNELDDSVRPAYIDGNGVQTDTNAGNGDELRYIDAAGADTSDEAIYGLAAETQIGGVDVAAWYQVDGSKDEKEEIDTTGLSLGYSVGNFSGLAVVQSIDNDVGELSIDGTVENDPSSRTEYFLQGVYSLSDQFNLVGEYAQQDKEDDLGDLMSVGAVYNF